MTKVKTTIDDRCIVSLFHYCSFVSRRLHFFIFFQLLFNQFPDVRSQQVSYLRTHQNQSQIKYFLKRSTKRNTNPSGTSLDHILGVFSPHSIEQGWASKCVNVQDSWYKLQIKNLGIEFMYKMKTNFTTMNFLPL